MLTNEMKDRCAYIIHGAATTAGAIGLSPIPGSDAAPIMATQVAMILALGSALKVPVEKSFASSLAKNAIAKQAGKYLAGQILKVIPFVGSAGNAAVAFGITEALGWDFVNEYAGEMKEITC